MLKGAKFTRAVTQVCRGVKLFPAESFETKARPVFDAARKARIVNPGMEFDAFALRLRRVLTSEQLRTRDLGEIGLNPQILRRALNPKDDCPSTQLWNTAIEFEEAENEYVRFVEYCEKLRLERDPGELPHPKAFFVSGPLEVLRFGPDEDGSSFAAFPDFNLGEGQFCYVVPKADNLVGIQFRVVDPAERLLKKYAYDASVPEKFSLYSYNEEERRQFALLNQHLLTGAEIGEQEKGIERLRGLCELLVAAERHKGQPIATGPNKFKIAGPARRIALTLSSGKYASFTFLNLEKLQVYWIEMMREKLPGTERIVPCVKFYPVEGQGPSSTHYYIPAGKRFAQIVTGPRKVDKKYRAVIPTNLRARSWDDEGGPGIIL